MTEPKLKIDKEAGNLSETAKSMIEEQWLYDKHGYFEEVATDEMMKGIECEQDSMALAQKVLKGEFRVSFKKNLNNEFITGTPDIVLKDYVEDIKTSWSIKTFFNADISTLYYWQLQGYMWLTGKEKARLIYCLVNTPEQMVIDMQKRVFYKYDGDSQNPDYIRKRDQIKRNHTFDHIPEADKVKTFEVELNKTGIDVLIEKCKRANEYYNTLKL